MYRSYRTVREPCRQNLAIAARHDAAACHRDQAVATLADQSTWSGLVLSQSQCQQANVTRHSTKNFTMVLPLTHWRLQHPWPGKLRTSGPMLAGPSHPD